MYTKTVLTAACLAAIAAAAPAPQVAGYTDADAPYMTISTTLGPVATSFGRDSQIPATETNATSAFPRVTANVTGPTSHGPFSGTATTTGALQANTTLGSVITPLPPNPTETYYNAGGKLLNPEPIPFTPNGMSFPRIGQALNTC